MRNVLNVNFNLDRLACYDEGDGAGDAEPYLWTVFFKIDGTTCRLKEDLFLEGTATVFTTPGSHRNLGVTDVDAGDTVMIPQIIGSQEMTLTPIPVPDSVKALGVDDVTAIAGCIVVLMEEDNVSDSGAEAGHAALNNAVQNVLDTLIPTLGFTNQSIPDSDIQQFIEQIKTQISAAIKSNQSFLENLWSLSNPDDTIGSVVWRFSGDDLLSGNPVSLQQRWSNEGDWELFGSINTVEIPPCPAEVIQAILEALFGAGALRKSMDAMREFRDTDMKNYRSLSIWWQVARQNSHYLSMALKDRELAKAAFTVFRDIPEILNNRDRALSDEHFDTGLMILRHMSELDVAHRQSRKDIKRSMDALKMLRGKTPNEIFKVLSSIKPARHPSIDAIGEDSKFDDGKNGEQAS